MKDEKETVFVLPKTMLPGQVIEIKGNGSKVIIQQSPRQLLCYCANCKSFLCDLDINSDHLPEKCRLICLECFNFMVESPAFTGGYKVDHEHGSKKIR
jgi:hypothetical protein